MTYIYPITEPKILKLGIRMALYGERKPKDNNYPDYKNVNLDELKKEFEKFTQSRIVYLKEPEFKAGEEVWERAFGKKFMITVISLNGVLCFDPRVTKGIGQDRFKHECSHYYLGQEVESFKYVREVKVGEREDPHTMKTKYGMRKSSLTVEIFEWQEVEEPTYNDFDDLKVNPFEQNDCYENAKDQFQEDKKAAKILAEI